MRTAARIVACCLLAVCAALPAASAQSAAADSPNYAKANAERIQAYIVLLRLRHDLYLRWKQTGRWPDDKAANAALAAHGEYWARQLGLGHALLAGGMEGDYWDNAALIVFEAASEAEANRIAMDDPAVKAFVFQAQVRPFGIHFISDKYAPPR